MTAGQPVWPIPWRSRYLSKRGVYEQQESEPEGGE